MKTHKIYRISTETAGGTNGGTYLIPATSLQEMEATFLTLRKDAYHEITKVEILAIGVNPKLIPTV